MDYKKLYEEEKRLHEQDEQRITELVERTNGKRREPLGIDLEKFRRNISRRGFMFVQ